MKRIVSIVFSLVFATTLLAQNNEVRQAYIEKYKATAVKKMLEHGIPASITLAQGILESGAGKSSLATEANNHFGIKCHNDWQGDTYIMDDDKKNECFRKYKTAAESFEDHSLFLTRRSRYAFLFEYPVTDYKKWAHGLKKAGYATNPKYAHLLIKVIEDNQLYKYDKIKSLRELGVEEEEEQQTQKPPQDLVSAQAGAQDFKPVSVSKENRLVYENEGVKYVLAVKGDRFEKIAAEFDVYTWQLRKYNEADKKTPVKAGDFIYLEKKNSKAKVKYHIVQRGETLRSICQRYAVRMKSIMKKNGIKKKKAELREGERLKLR
jgi:flagellum-specific peptidoglycan hydrolase FlgJ/LysM repeat protein